MALQTPNYYMPTWNNPQMIPQQASQQQNGVTPVRAKEEAQYYPVAPGNSMVFRKEDGSSMFIKTMGYSTMEPPIFEEYARVINEQDNKLKYEDEISKLWGEINALKTKQNNSQSNSKNKDNGGN